MTTSTISGVLPSANKQISYGNIRTTLGNPSGVASLQDFYGDSSTEYSFGVFDIPNRTEQFNISRFWSKLNSFTTRSLTGSSATSANYSSPDSENTTYAGLNFLTGNFGTRCKLTVRLTGTLKMQWADHYNYLYIGTSSSSITGASIVANWSSKYTYRSDPQWFDQSATITLTLTRNTIYYFLLYNNRSPLSGMTCTLTIKEVGQRNAVTYKSVGDADLSGFLMTDITGFQGEDDASVFAFGPTFKIAGTSYTTYFVCTNQFINFSTGSIVYSNLSASRPNVPTLHLNSGDTRGGNTHFYESKTGGNITFMRFGLSFRRTTLSDNVSDNNFDVTFVRDTTANKQYIAIYTGAINYSGTTNMGLSNGTGTWLVKLDTPLGANSSVVFESDIDGNNWISLGVPSRLSIPL
jgi:hypothetical protein